MMQSTLERYVRPDRLLFLGHVNIQTCDRFTEKLGFGSAAGLEASGDLPRSTMPTTATTAAASWATSAAGDVASRSPNTTAPIRTPATGSTVSMTGKLARSAPAL